MSGKETHLKEKVLDAYQRIKQDIIRTPLQYSPSLSQKFKTQVYLKWENEQLTGSFKFRGALNKLRSLPEEQKKKGIVSASTGNHGLGLSRACELEGVALTLFLPKNAAQEKLDRLKKYRISLNLFGSSCEKAEIHARQVAEDKGKTFVSPYNDFDIIYGQGTVGVEIFEDLPGVEDVIVPVGGGGLISGIAGYLKSMSPGIRIFGVEPESSCFMSASLAAGRIVEIDEKKTLADAVAGGIEPGSVTFSLCQQYVARMVTVKEENIAESMAVLFEHHQKAVEGAGALCLAGLMAEPDIFYGRKVILVVSGGNISQKTLP